MEIVYPADIKGDQRKAFKQAVLHEQPEALYGDTTSQNQRTNLIFYTERSHIWKSVISNYFPYTKKRGICKGCQISVYDSAELSSQLHTINLYNSVMVLIQGNEASLHAFEKSFPLLKQTVQEETAGTEVESEEENGLMPYSPVSTSPAPFDDLMIEQDTHSSCYLRCLPEKVALLEMELAELKQLILSRPDEFTIKNLKAEIKDLHNINTKMKAEMSKMKEDSVQRERKLERNIQELKEKLEEQNAVCLQHKSQDSESPNIISSESAPPLQHEDPSHSSPAPDRAHTQPASLSSAVVLLMDSIGKHIEPEKLFPRQRVLALHCRNTERAHQLLSAEQLGRPQSIIIHSGTNDLLRLKEGTARAMCAMAERASQTFPAARVLISSLLPRLDVPPSVIDQINEELRRSCSSLPNVHLVSHSAIRPWHLHDGLHLNQDGVRIFAKAIKDVALGRFPTTGYRGTKRHQMRLQPFDPSGPPSHSRPPQDLQRRPLPSRWSHGQQERQLYARAPAPPRPPEPSQHRRSYAQVVSQQPSPPAQELSSSDVGEIKQMLHLLCNKMFN